MVPVVVVEIDELPDRNFQASRHIVRQLVHVPLQCLLVPLQYLIRLRVIRRSEYVPHSNQLEGTP